MTARTALCALGLAAAAAFAAAVPVRAQCRLCEVPITTREATDAKPTMALQVEAGLDFDRLVLLGPSGGSATLRPDGTRQVSGAIQAIGGRAMVGEARVRGEPGRAVRIDLPRRVELQSQSGSRIVIDDIATDLPAMPRLDPAGQLSFRFGGRLEVVGDQEGDFRGDLTITADYL
ncbi:MAG TPA: DUF4402 domain-containing protein [Sphingomicrobium sp.]|nr:DUF4402 domain-containing protein [Sphingomicrobium sp.]